MPRTYRDYGTNAYITIRLNKSSKIYQRLVEDAELRDVKLHELILVRLGDYYQKDEWREPNDQNKQGS